VIYLVGTSSDSTTRHFAREAAACDAAVEWVDLAVLTDGRWHIDLDGDAELWSGGQRVAISPGASVYARLVTEGDASQDPEQVARSRALLAALASWLELSGGRVVNRPGHVLDNGSKPLHEVCLRRAGFEVPPSVTSSDPERLRVFAEAHPVVVKTISGIRADCRRVDAAEFADFDPEQGPIHLQEVVEGQDVRIHVVGPRVIAVVIQSTSIDYRTAPDAAYAPFELPAELAARLVEATREMGLAFAGWDFKLRGDGVFFALEANPMPGYHPYDRHLGGTITRAVIDYLEDRP
jgi:glutathione synthase/RimK-type ligase-like ATP-grasp enzyme